MESLDDFRQVWLAHLQVEQPHGERPFPLGLTAQERHSGRQVRRTLHELLRSGPPYPLGPEVLWVTYDAAPALGCHLTLGWPMPKRVLDLQAEFRWLRSGLEVPGGYDLAGALNHFGLAGEGVEGLARLLGVMLPHLDLPRALLRGRYLAAVARMETVGVPIDVASLARLRDGWERVQDALIEQVDQAYGVYQGRRFNPRCWAAWLNRHRIQWPRLSSGELDLKQNTFREMAVVYPAVQPLKELRASLAQMRLFRLAVGPDGRNRCPLRPFASKTGRNQPSTAQFIFGPATWLRGLIKPAEGMALAYVDYEQQEFGIAAALSADRAMIEAYRSGDPYLTFARQAGVVPADATKASHREERERFKTCALGVQYGMGARSLAIRLGITFGESQRLLQLHRATYPAYWAWSREVVQQARREGRLTATFGWRLHIGEKANPRSVRNWPLQTNGAEMLRLACCFLTEAGVQVCAPVHDALLVEASVADIEEVVARCQREMQRASELVLPGFALRTEAKVVRHPDRYRDARGQAMWDVVFGLLDWEGMAKSA